ncbi:hypothetical protein GCM10010276_38890 [Streptomyces longisporus]|uniref:MarR family transcriptional regulator n=1 Tax=Streptomyces longisporus TaxID=1948 RepID=A0ABN3M355_STRLO
MPLRRRPHGDVSDVPQERERDRPPTAVRCTGHPQERSVLRLTSEGERQLAASRPIVESGLISLTAAVPPDELTRIAATLATLRATLEEGSHGRPG